MPLISFGDFSFEQSHMVQQKFTSNFGEQIVRTTKYPGLSGGIDEYGSAPGPGEIGVVWFSLTLVSYVKSEMETKRDAIKRLGDYGTRKLVYQPADPALPARWCYARINHIRCEQRIDEHTDYFQPVEMIFQVIWPYWETAGNRVFWDIEDTWDDLEVWGGPPDLVLGAGITSILITNNGSAITYPVIKIIPQTGQTLENLFIRKVNSPGETISLPDTLFSLEELEINCLSTSVLLHGDPYYGLTNFNPSSPYWMRLYPGDNLIQFTTDNDGVADVYIRYAEYWR